MATALLGVLAALDLVVAVICFRRRSCAATAIGVVALGIAYDAAVVAAGAGIGEGSTLRGLNAVRFAAHLLLTPLLIPALLSLSAARRSTPMHTKPAVVLTVVALLPAVTLVTLDLELARAAGLLRYTEPDPLPPLGAILAVLVSLAIGVNRVRRPMPPVDPVGGPLRRDWRMLAGVVVALVLFGVPPSTTAGLLCGAVAETILVATITSELVR